jgi:SnoaL-like domain
MSKALADLMERNLLEVFGQVDSARRAAVIAELYTADCTFFEAEEQVTGREALNAKVGSILKDAPGFLFRAAGPAQVNHDLGRLRWQLGPAGAPPVVTGTDIAVFEHGRIRALYTFLDQSAST